MGAPTRSFAALDADPKNEFDGVRDTPNQPLDYEPQRVKDDLRILTSNDRQA